MCHVSAHALCRMEDARLRGASKEPPMKRESIGGASGAGAGRDQLERNAGKPSSSDLPLELAAFDWASFERALDLSGHAVLPRLLSPRQCETLAAMYALDAPYRSRVVMARHGFGRGEYKYFDYPLPDLLQSLRTSLYPFLTPIANRWNKALRIDVRYPPNLQTFLDRCHAAGQSRATPLILQYAPGDYNCLHQDLHGEHVLPLQATILLARPGQDFTGGEFVMTEDVGGQRRGAVIALRQGDAVVFAVNHRPAQGVRGFRKAAMRHGVSLVRSGRRHTVGLIFHDAR
jgi:hypothetical protein